jgi:hypothetical protein
MKKEHPCLFRNVPSMVGNNTFKTTKSEILNSKQILITKIQTL